MGYRINPANLKFVGVTNGSGAGQWTAFLYVIEYADGVLKFGRTHNPRQRFGQLQRERKAHEVTRFAVSNVMSRNESVTAETAVVKRVASKFNNFRGRPEHIVGATFSQVRQLCWQMAKQARDGRLVWQAY